MPRSRLLQTTLNHFFSPERSPQRGEPNREPLASPTPSTSRTQEPARVATTLPTIALDSSSDDDLIITNYPGGAKKLDLKKEIEDDGDDDDDDEEKVHTTPISKRRGRRILDDDGDDDSNDNDEDAVIKSSPFSARRKRKVLSDQDEEHDNDPPHSLLSKVPEHRDKGKRKMITLWSDEEEDIKFTGQAEGAPDVKRKRLMQRDNELSDDEEQEDLDFLDENDVYEQRTRGRKKSQYSLALERLRDRKRSSFEGSKGPIDRFAKPETDSLLSSDDGDDDNNTDDDEDLEDEDQDEENFVVDDDVIDGVKVTPTDAAAFIAHQEEAELPAEFRAANTQRFSVNFKIYLEYLVNLVHDPKFANGAQAAYFQNAIKAVERRIRGYRDSLVASDAWLPRFKNALDKFPRWHDVRQSGLVCEGCRQNRPASCSVVLAAEPEETEIQPREETFSLGSECHKRAEVYHKLVHFRAHMYEHVRNEAEKITTEMDAADRGAGDLRLAEEILQVMHQNGFARTLYSRVQDLLSKARQYYMERGERFYGNSASSSSSSSEDEDGYSSP